MGVGPAALGWSPPLPLVPEGEMLGNGGEGGPASLQGCCAQGRTGPCRVSFGSSLGAWMGPLVRDGKW